MKTMTGLVATLVVGAVCAPAFAQVRVFLAADGEQAVVATTGNTTMTLTAGTTRTVGVWLADTVQDTALNSYQIVLEWVATPADGAQGRVAYVDAGVSSGDSVQIDTGRPDYVFAGLSANAPVYNETAPPPTTGSGIGFIGSRQQLTNGALVSGIRYLGQFDLSASATACGSHVLSFVALGNQPVGGTSLSAPGGVTAYDVDEFQSLTVVIGGSTAVDLDDCNVNGIFDGCDIEQGHSSDVDVNGIPDECLTSQAGGNWSAAIWGLGGADPYPDDFSGVADRHVTIDGHDVSLDIAVQVDSLRLINGATLRVVRPAPPLGDLTVEGGMAVHGATLELDHDHQVDVFGPLTVGAGGIIRAAAGHQVPLAAALSAPEVTLAGGTLSVQSAMVIDCAGTLRLDGSAGVAPTLTVINNGAVSAETLRMDVEANADLSSTAPLILGRSFSNRLTTGLFDWPGGAVRFAGGPGPAPVAQAFEVGGRDRGPFGDGFSSNYSLGTLEIEGGAHVVFADGIDNDGQGQSPFSEALYVDTLILRNGALATIVDVNVYYRTLLIESGAEVTAQSSGALIELCAAATCCDLNVDGRRDDPCVWCACADDLCTSQTTAFADLGGAFGACQADGFSNIHDRNHALTCFAVNNPCDLVNIDAGGAFANCTPDGFCNVHDANHAINAFQGTTTCACGPAPETPIPAPSAHATLLLEARRDVARPSERVAVDVLLGTALDALQSYQLTVRPSGGRAGTMRLIAVDIGTLSGTGSDETPDFYAVDLVNGRMLAGVDDLAGRDVASGTVLATFVYQVSREARGPFLFDVVHDPASADQTALVGPNLRPIAIDAVDPAVITIRPSPRKLRR